MVNQLTLNKNNRNSTIYIYLHKMCDDIEETIKSILIKKRCFILYSINDLPGFLSLLRMKIGKDLVPKSTPIRFEKVQILVESSSVSDITEIFKEYNFYTFSFFKDEEETFKILRLVRQYYVEPISNEQRYQNEKSDELWNKIMNFKIENSLKDYELTEEEYKSYKPYFQEVTNYAYFVVDSSDEEEIKKILTHTLGKEVIPQRFNINSTILNIEQMSVFEIAYPEIPIYSLRPVYTSKDTIKSYLKLSNKKYDLSFKIWLMLDDDNLNSVVYEDKCGVIDIYDPKVTIKNRTKRKSKWNFREDLGMIFDSSWEANVARTLSYLKIPFVKEEFPINLKHNDSDGTMIYLPDFFLENNVIIEVKGFWDIRSLQRIHAFKEQIKDYSLLILDGDMYIHLKERYKHKIANWEESNSYKPSFILEAVGINRPDRIKVVKELVINEEVYFERDFGNIYDKNAIKIVNKSSEQFGFLKKEWASVFAEKIDMGMNYTVKVKSIHKSHILLDAQRNNFHYEVLYDFLKG